MQMHPCPDDNGKPVQIKQPSTPTPLAAWSDPLAIATTVHLHPIVDGMNGLAFAPWTDHPTTAHAWRHVVGRHAGSEGLAPLAPPAPHLKAAAGVVIEETDGRVWVVSPTNRFGYVNTFPKGKADGGFSDDLQSVAIREAFEESGLRVEITGFLADSVRGTSITRFFRARRIGGHPSHMGWESQAVHLVPRAMLESFVENEADKQLVRLLLKK